MKKILVTLTILCIIAVSIDAKMLGVGANFGLSNLNNDSFSATRGNKAISGFLTIKTPIIPLQFKAGATYNNSPKDDTILNIPYKTYLNNLALFLSADIRYHIIMTPITPYFGVGADINNLTYKVNTTIGSVSVVTDTTYKSEIGVNGHIGLAIEPVKSFSIFAEGYYGQIFTSDLDAFNNKNISDFGGKIGIILYFF